VEEIILDVSQTSAQFLSNGHRFLGGDSWSCMSKLTNLSALTMSFSGDPSRRLPSMDSSSEALKNEGSDIIYSLTNST